jgi:DNA-3-methyladenine glycosylase I
VWRFNDAATLSADLKERGFRFVGTTTVHAFMQAVGMVNAHDKRCFRYRELNGA